jgi:hypothetical protein
VTGASGQSTPEESSGSWPSSRAELDEVFGVVGRARFDAEWMALEGPGVVPVRGSDIPGLFASHHEGQTLSDLLREALRAHDLTGDEFPELCGKVSAQGRAMVNIGGVSARTVLRLIAVLESAQPGPAATRPAVGPR